jgi:hypothetical protein
MFTAFLLLEIPHPAIWCYAVGNNIANLATDLSANLLPRTHRSRSLYQIRFMHHITSTITNTEEEIMNIKTATLPEVKHIHKKANMKDIILVCVS